MKYPEDFINQVICGDCLKVMKTMPDNCIDTIITDSPYNLSTIERFKAKDSGEKWNVKSGVFHRTSKGFMGQEWDNEIAFQIETWEAVYRIAKPGATLLCFGGTRTYHRLACAIEDAGFVLKDCIMWLYGSGFPKASDISKQIDKGHKREVIGKRKGTYADIRRDKNTGIAELHGGIAKQKKRINSYITAPATPEAILWNGWKSHGLKPAYEPILVCMKPNEGSYANNALKWGVAGLNIDGGRIETDSNDPNRRTAKPLTYGKPNDTFLGALSSRRGDFDSKGRYPANVILDEEAGRMLDEQSGISCGKRPHEIMNKTKSNFNAGLGIKTKRHHDIGGASRFFYCAKASKAERNRGCEGLEKKYSDDTRKDKDAIGCNNPRNRSGIPEKNYHPTVKPLILMKYLCTLTNTPTGGIVLDPFCGSGTTLMACKELKRDYIGIDNISEYCEIARKRVNATPETLF